MDFLKNLLKTEKVLLGNDLKWKLILLIFLQQSHTSQNSCSWFMGQNADNQSSQKHGGSSWFLPADKCENIL